VEDNTYKTHVYLIGKLLWYFNDNTYKTHVYLIGKLLWYFNTSVTCKLGWGQHMKLMNKKPHTWNKSGKKPNSNITIECKTQKFELLVEGRPQAHESHVIPVHTQSGIISTPSHVRTRLSVRSEIDGPNTIEMVCHHEKRWLLNIKRSDCWHKEKWWLITKKNDDGEDEVHIPKTALKIFLA